MPCSELGIWGGIARTRHVWRSAAYSFLVSLLLFPVLATAAQDRFDYDPLGRLVRVIDSNGKATEYQYDPAGNILKVITGGTVQSPAISSITPSIIRRGQTLSFTVAGTGLSNTNVSMSDGGLVVTSPATTAQQATFNLYASASAALGAQQVRLTSAAGTAAVPITVMPTLPKVNVSPAPMAIPPDGVFRNFTISLSNADVIDHTIALSSGNTAKVAVQPSSITIPAGQTEAQAQIKGIAAGTASINLNSTTLGNTSVPVFITAEFKGINTSFSPGVGVVLEGISVPVEKQETAYYPRAVRVVMGAYLDGVAPKSLAQGSGPTNLVLSGEALQGVSSISIQPNTGLTIGTMSVAADGKSLTLPVTVAADAPPTARKVIVQAGANRIIPATADGDQIKIVRLPPAIDSIDPLFATRGAIAMTLTIRGRNLQEATAVTAAPATGLVFDSTPSVNADGTVLTVRLSIDPLANTGPRVITVTTPGGSSGVEAAAANTFTIVSDIGSAITPISSPLVGVVLQDNSPPAQISQNPQSAPVQVTLGPVFTGMTPAVRTIGDNFTLTLQGRDLQGVTSLQFVPATGITVGALSVQPDGNSISVPITIAENAPQTLRTVKLFAGTVPVYPSQPTVNQFRVTARLAEIVSMDPVVMKIGAAATTLTVRGRNFQNVSEVRFTPSDGVQISNPPTVNSDQTQLTVTVTVGASAQPGQRVVSLVTPAGESDTTSTAANTVTLANNVGGTITPIFTRVGVVLTDNTPPSTIDTQAIAPQVGVVLQDGSPAPQQAIGPLVTMPVGAVVGPYADKVTSGNWVQGGSGELTITGDGLNAVTSIALTPATGLTFTAAPTISSDGKQLTVPYNVAADAPSTVREIALNGQAGRILFVNPMGGIVFVVPAAKPTFDSITPILATQGNLITLTVRGQNLQGVQRIYAEPADGLVFDTVPTVNATGTEATVRVQINSDAPLGARVIRLATPAGDSPAEATERNTFTVYAP